MSGYIVCQCPPECHIVFSDMNPQLTSLFIIKIKVFSKLTHLSLRFPLTLCVFWLLINVALLPPFFPLINSPYGCLKALSLEVNILFLSFAEMNDALFYNGGQTPWSAICQGEWLPRLGYQYDKFVWFRFSFYINVRHQLSHNPVAGLCILTTNEMHQN